MYRFHFKRLHPYYYHILLVLLLIFRFCVSVFRDNYPAEYIANTSMMKQGSLFVQPGHFITVVAPVRIVNLLPLDLKYTIKSTYITNVLKPGKTATLHCVSKTDYYFELAMN